MLHLVLVKIFGNDYYGKWPQAMLDNTTPAIRGNSSTIERHPAPGSQTRMQNRVHPLLSLPITNVLVGLLRNCLACVWPAPLKLVSALSVCWATIFFSLIALTQLDFKCFTLELISSSCFSEIVLHLPVYLSNHVDTIFQYLKLLISDKNVQTQMLLHERSPQIWTQAWSCSCLCVLMRLQCNCSKLWFVCTLRQSALSSRELIVALRKRSSIEFGPFLFQSSEASWTTHSIY